MSSNPNDVLSITRDKPSVGIADPLDFLSLTRGPQRGQPSPYDIARSVSPSFQKPSQIERGDGRFSLLSPITEFGKGLWQSLSRTNFEMLGETIQAAGETFVHRTEDKRAVQDMGKRLQDWARSGEQPEPPVTWEEAEGVMGTLTYLGGLAGSGIGSTIPPLVGGAVGFLAGGPAGAAVGAFSIGSALNTGEAYAQFKREGIEDSAQWAVSVGQVVSVLDTIGLGKVVDAAGMKKIKSKAIGNLVKRVAAVGKGMTAEGFTEMAQSSIRESTAAALTGNPNVRERAFSILEEGLAGALTGGIISGAGQGAQALGRTPRKTTAEAAGDEGAAAARARATGNPLDRYVEAGERVVAEINADADVGTRLQELGFSSPGGEMVYRAPDGTEERVILRGLVPAEDIDGVQAPESILLETLAGDQFDESLPLRESVSLTPVPTPEGVAADADFTRFSEEIGALAEGLPEGAMETEMAREGADALENIPQERRQELLKALKTKAKESSNVAREEIGAIEDQEAKETADRDAQLIFDQQVEDLRGEYGDVDQVPFETVDASIRQRMGISVGEPVPAARHKAYLTLMHKRSADTQAKPKTEAKPRGVEPEIPTSVVRTEEKGAKIGSPDKPHGLYTSPADLVSPHSDLGGLKRKWDVNPSAKVLTIKDFGEEVIMRRGAISSGLGVHAARQLLGPGEFKRLKGLSKDELLKEAKAINSSVQWERYFDEQEIMEGIGGVIARGNGYDAMWQPDVLSPEFSEFVALNNNALREPSTAGRGGTVHTPQGGKYEVEYRVVESDEVIASNVVAGREVGARDPKHKSSLQPRDLQHPDEQGKIRDIARNLNPAILTDSHTADSGAPVVGQDLMVEQGNGRMLALKLAYKSGKAEEYKKHLAEQGYDVGAMEQPVLVRVRTEGQTDAERKKFVRESSTPIAAVLGTADKAMADASEISEGIFGSYKGGELADLKNREFVRQFISSVIPTTERKDFTTDQGDPDSSGISRMEAALMAYAYESKGIVTTLKATEDPLRKSIRNVMTEMAAPWAKAKNLIREVDPKQDITSNLVDAVTLVHRSIGTESTPLDIFSQASLISGTDPMVEGERGEINKQVMKWFYKKDPFAETVKGKGEKKKAGSILPAMASQQKILERMQSWVGKVSRYDPKQSSMFQGDTIKPMESLMAGELSSVDEGPSLFDQPKSAPSKPPAGRVATRRIASRDTLKMSDAELDALTGKLNEIAAKIAPMADLALYDTESVPYLKPASVGAYYHEESLIALALRSTEIDPQATLHHEAIHALRSYQLFSDAEWNSLKEHADKQGWIEKYELQKYYPDLFNNGQPFDEAYEESIAWAYEDWVSQGLAGEGVVLRVFTRIRRFLRNFARAISGDKELSNSLEEIFGRIGSGEIGAREPAPAQLGAPATPASRVIKKDGPEQTAKESSFAFEDTELQGEYEQDRRGAGKGRDLKVRLKEFAGGFFQSFVRVHKDLPRTAAWSKAHDWLADILHAREYAVRQTIDHLNRFTKGLTPRQLDMASLKVFMDDLSEDVRKGMPIPLFKSPEQFRKEYRRLNAELSKPENKELVRRVRARDVQVRQIAENMVKAGIISKEALDRQHYITHQVLEYARDEISTAAQSSGTLKKPRWAARKGTKMAINMNLFEAESQWMIRAHVDLATAGALKKFKDSAYNRRDKVLSLIKQQNKAAKDAAVISELRVIGIPQEVRLGNTLESAVKWLYSDEGKPYRAQANELPFFGALNAHRINIGMKTGKLADLLDSVDPDVPTEYRDAVSQLTGFVGDEEQVNVWPLVSWLSEGNLDEVSKEFANHARGIFGTIIARRQLIKNQLGNDWINSNNLDAALKRMTRMGYAEVEGMEAWQPDKGNLLFTATALPEKVVAKLYDRVQKVISEDPRVASLIDQEMIQDVVHSLKSQTVMGGPKYQMVLDARLASTLNSFKDEHLETQLGGVINSITKAWKVAMLLLPHRIVKYSIRNVSGDLDRVNTSMGFKGLNPKEAWESMREIWAVEMQGKEASPLYLKGLRSGVLSSGFSLEVYLENQKEVAGYFTESGSLQTKANNAWRTMVKSNTMRENVMRFSVYRIITKRIGQFRAEHQGNSGKELAPTPENVDKVFAGITYGMTDKNHLRELDNWDAVASNYALETLGNYGNISVAGRWLRKNLIPFWSWKEISARGAARYVINVKDEFTQGNTKQAMAMARAGAATGMKRAAFLYARMFAWYAAVHLWNNGVHRDLEEELTDEDRRRLHLILGKYNDEIIMLPTPGAMSDVLAWVGFEDVLGAFQHIAAGRGDMGDVMEAVSGGFVNTVAQGVSPIYKLPVELLIEKTAFPDVLRPRTIKNRWHHVQRAIGIDKPVQLIGALTNSGQPTQGAFHLIAGTLVDKRHSEYSAYSKIRSIAYQWKSHVEGEQSFQGVMSPRAEAYYNYRLALKFNDEAAVVRWRKQLRELGVTREQREAMLNRARPLGMLTEKQKTQFKRGLSETERRSLNRARKYWSETYRGN